MIRRQVKTPWERKRVSNDAFPLGVISLDGKSIWTSSWKQVPGAKQQDNQPTLMKLAEEGFAESCSARRVSLRERRNGARVERTLSTLTVSDIPEFAELGTQEMWQVLQESIEDSTGKVTTEVRYFLSSLPAKDLSPTQKLGLIRLHWGIENGLHWTLDAQLEADDHQRCQLSSRALEVTCWLRALAYNLLSARRGPKSERPPPAWRRVMVKLRDLFVHGPQGEPLSDLA